MFKSFLDGFITCIPFISINKYYPQSLYRNDWRTIGNDLKKILRKCKENN